MPRLSPNNHTGKIMSKYKHTDLMDGWHEHAQIIAAIIAAYFTAYFCAERNMFEHWETSAVEDFSDPQRGFGSSLEYSIAFQQAFGTVLVFVTSYAVLASLFSLLAWFVFDSPLRGWIAQACLQILSFLRRFTTSL